MEGAELFTLSSEDAELLTSSSEDAELLTSSSEDAELFTSSSENAGARRTCCTREDDVEDDAYPLDHVGRVRFSLPRSTEDVDDREAHTVAEYLTLQTEDADEKLEECMDIVRRRQAADADHVALESLT